MQYGKGMDVFRERHMVTGRNGFFTPTGSNAFARPADCGSFTSSEQRVSMTNQHKSAQEIVLRTLSRWDDRDDDLLSQITSQEWKRLLTWLDTSGLALYFFDRVRKVGRLNMLPQFVIKRLERNLRHNTERTRGLTGESIAIQRGFQSAGIRYAVLKGISLCPVAVPQPELRHQFDLDYIVAQTDLDKARKELERLGYRVHALGERCWEFKKGETPYVSAKDLYKDLAYRGVELHLGSSAMGAASQLDSVTGQVLGDITMPLLAPIDLFIAHAMDVFKDVCGSFTRASHLLEFYRHVLTRFDDDSFWAELRRRVAGDRKTRFGIAVVNHLAETLMGTFAPDVLTIWTVQELSPAIRLWVKRYGRDSVFAEPPGTKLYLLLRRELEREGILPQQKIMTSLLPAQLPQVVVRGFHGEHLSTRIARYNAQIRFVLSRLRFHCVEGLRFAFESYRWERQLERLQ
jgi:hypothetical protein